VIDQPRNERERERMGCSGSKPKKALERPPQSWVKFNISSMDFDGDRYIDLLSLALQRSPVFQTWSIGHIRNLSNNAMERIYYDMEPIYKEGEEADGIYFIKSGRVEITTLSKGSIDMLAKSALFGENEVASKQKRTQNAIARGAQTTVIRISRADYHGVIVTKDAVVELPTFITLRDSIIYMGLSEPQLITLHSFCELEHFNPGETIFKRMSPATERLYVVHKGSVTISEIPSAYDLNSLWKLEWAGLNTFVDIYKLGYFGDSSIDPSGIESNPPPNSPAAAGGGHTVTAVAGPKGCTVLSISRTHMVSKAELRGVLERVVLNIQVRDQDLRRESKIRPLDAWMSKVGQAPPTSLVKTISLGVVSM